MPPTLKKLRGHIGLGLSVRPSVCPLRAVRDRISVRPSVCPLRAVRDRILKFNACIWNVREK